ncbi:hypothetical protein B0H17DRAFT_1179737, partial [Mycena rosella]
IRLNAYSSNGPITIHLPPSFRGPVTIRSPAVRVSEHPAAELTTFSEEEHARRYFVGDFSAWTEEWAGDTLEVESACGSGGARVHRRRRRGEFRGAVCVYVSGCVQWCGRAEEGPPRLTTRATCRRPNEGEQSSVIIFAVNFKFPVPAGIRAPSNLSARPVLHAGD